MWVAILCLAIVFGVVVVERCDTYAREQQSQLSSQKADAVAVRLSNSDIRDLICSEGVHHISDLTNQIRKAASGRESDKQLAKLGIASPPSLMQGLRKVGRVLWHQKLSLNQVLEMRKYTGVGFRAQFTFNLAQCPCVSEREGKVGKRPSV
jgi:hypothetical protein